MPQRTKPTQRPVHMEQRTLRIARQILSMAAHPDKCLLRHMHDISANAGGLFVFRSDPPNPTMQLYKLMRPFRGTRLATSFSDPAALAAQHIIIESVRAGPGRVVVAVANFQDVPVQIHVNLLGLGNVSSIVGMTLDETSLRNLSLPVGDSIWSLTSASVTVAEIFVQPERSATSCTVRRHEYFSEAVMVPLANNTPACTPS